MAHGVYGRTYLRRFVEVIITASRVVLTPLLIIVLTPFLAIIT
jgi:hypothetical protein